MRGKSSTAADVKLTAEIAIGSKNAVTSKTVSKPAARGRLRTERTTRCCSGQAMIAVQIAKMSGATKGVKTARAATANPKRSHDKRRPVPGGDEPIAPAGGASGS